MRLDFTINGESVSMEAQPNALLLDIVRDQLGLTATKASCGVQVCGVCTVLVDGEVVSSCCMLAADVAGRQVQTVEGLADDPLMVEIADAFLRHAALQCGFCTPGMVLTLWTLIRDGAPADEHAMREHLAGNLCRCTGYKAIIDAAVDVAQVAVSSR